MIKKLIGIAIVVAVIVIVVITAIRRDNFRSMVLRDQLLDQPLPAGPASQAGTTEGGAAPAAFPAAGGAVVPAADAAGSAASGGEVVLVDSLTVETIDSL